MRHFIKVFCIISVLFLASCGTTTTVDPQPTILSGVAATGAPISDAPVICKGKNGLSARATTDSDGNYTMGVRGLL